MTSSPLVSVIVPAYNAEAFLDAALASAQCQTYRRLEVLVVDDGSQDQTYPIARRWAQQDKRFVALQHEVNQGLPSTRNTALRHAKGELVAFLDADDIWLPDKVALQVDLLREDPRANILFTNYWIWDGEKDLFLRYSNFKKFPEGDVSRRLYYWSQFGISSVMVKRETLDAVTGPALQ